MTFLGYSWFRSVKTCVAVRETGHHAVMVIKTSRTRYPKIYLDKKMKYFPKYNSRKVLVLVNTLGAGSTLPGVPYQKKYNDQ